MVTRLDDTIHVGQTGHIADHQRLASKANYVFDVKDFGAVGDGTTDDTDAIQAAIDAAGVTGGEVFFPALTFLVEGALTGPTHKATAHYDAVTVRLQGAGADAFSGETSTRDPSGGTIFDMRYTTGPACLDLRGSGRVTIKDILFWQNGTAHTNPYIQITNTVTHISQCTFFGHTDNAQETCDQDAIVFGGTTTTIDDTSDAPFQGYGTIVERCHFQRIRRAGHWRMYANAITMRDNTVWHLCGSPSGGGIPAFDVESSGVLNYAVGNTIQNNLIEMPGYDYGIRLRPYALATQVMFNNFYDFGGHTVAPIKIDSGSDQNVVIGGYAQTDTAHVIDDDGNSLVLHSNSADLDPNVISQTTKLGNNEGVASEIGTVEFVSAKSPAVLIQGDEVRSDASAIFQVSRSAAEASNPSTIIMKLQQRGDFTLGGDQGGRIIALNAAGTEVARFDSNMKTWQAAGVGSAMEINSGTGGSYLTLQNYGVKLVDQAGANTVTLKNGTSTPESNFAAPVGSLFLRTDGGAGTSLYVKESGTGNTGWVALAGVSAETYSPSNVTTDRTYDADSTTIDEVSDVLGTLIADLQATGLIG